MGILRYEVLESAGFDREMPGSIYAECWAHPTPFLSQEYQPCNTNPCPELKKTTPWTPWTPVNISDNGGHYEQRFRYTCKARLPDPNLLEVGRQRIEMRYCSSDGTSGCSTDGEWGLLGSDPLPWTGMWSFLFFQRRAGGVFPFNDLRFSSLTTHPSRAELAV